MIQPRQKAITWGVLIGALGLLGSGMLIAYSISTKLETALGELQTAYAAEQAETQKLTQEAEALVKAMEQAQARVKAVEGSHRAARQAKGKFEAKATKLAKDTKLATALRELQTPYATEQAKTQKPTKEMAKTPEPVSRFGADIVTSYHAIGISYNMLGMNEEAVKAFQMAVELDPNHAESHFDLARVYIEYLDDSESAVPHFRRYVQLRPEAKDVEQIKGWLMKVEKELKIKKEHRQWGKGLSQGLYKIFY
jgi:tetratricopeptide (TPR) repeat protein